MRYDYDGKNVIVTGATGGIGKEVARGIIAGGGSVALIGLTLDEANKVAAELASTPILMPWIKAIAMPLMQLFSRS